MTHYLKTRAIYWEAVKRGDKTYEVRKNDRFFQTGDVVELCKWDEGDRSYLTRLGSHTCEIDEAAKLCFRIGGILQGGQFGIAPGFCVFSLLPLQAPSPKQVEAQP